MRDDSPDEHPRRRRRCALPFVHAAVGSVTGLERGLSPPIDEHECARLIESVKDAGMRPLEWHETVIDGHVIMRRVPELGLTTSPPPSLGSLIVAGHWKGPQNIQLMLQLMVNGTQLNVARLCWNRQHQDDLHWHWSFVPGGRESRESVTHPPHTIDHGTMTRDVFVPRLKIGNLQAVLV